jgi:hypothetical protein
MKQEALPVRAKEDVPSPQKSQTVEPHEMEATDHQNQAQSIQYLLWFYL